MSVYLGTTGVGIGALAPMSVPKYGVRFDDMLGNLDANGVLQHPSNTYSISSTDMLGIGDYGLRGAFYSDYNLISVSLPNVTSIGFQGLQHAFNSCTSLTSVDLSGVTTIGNSGLYSAFYGASGLVSIDLSNTTSAGTSALYSTFFNCTSLKNVNFKKISSGSFNQTFNGCTSLETVDFSEATAIPTLSNVNAFANTNGTYMVIVPDALYSTWIAAQNWSSISSHIVKASEVVRGYDGSTEGAKSNFTNTLVRELNPNELTIETMADRIGG